MFWFSSGLQVLKTLPHSLSYSITTTTNNCPPYNQKRVEDMKAIGSMFPMLYGQLSRHHSFSHTTDPANQHTTLQQTEPSCLNAPGFPLQCLMLWAKVYSIVSGQLLMGSIEVYDQKQFSPGYTCVHTISSSVNKLTTNIPCHGEAELKGESAGYQKEEVAHLSP